MEEESEDSGEKPYEPTPRKLEEARRQGDAPHSADLTAAAGLLGFLAAAFTFGPAALSQFGLELANLYRAAERLSLGSGASWERVVSACLALVPLFAFPVAFAAVAVVAQGAAFIAPKRIEPKLANISPLKNAGKKFGRSGLFEFAKSTLKLIVISALLGAYLWSQIADVLASIATSPRGVVALLLSLTVGFLAVVFLLSAFLGVLDFVWQNSEFLRRNRMSRKELLDEMKRNEGDPVVKQERRARAAEIAGNRMMADVPGADVVIVNPTHYAVALAWDRSPKSAPTCVAKGTDFVAQRIRDAAMIAGVPIRSDPPAARALFSTTDVGAEIAPEHYRAVAAAIRFADFVRRKAKGKHGA
ncbi:MAG: flagellar type III secretion system protein FlhB [Pseudomonadota bacterium]